MRRPTLVLAVVVTIAALGLACTACSPGYVLRAGLEEARILANRQPIDAAVEDTSLSVELRGKLQLVRQVRAFAERQLGLDAGSTYRSFTELDRDTLVMVVSAAPVLELRWKTWWFPIVGHLPYKGFFDFEAAFEEAAELATDGYDTYVRPSAAFSTLGWFPDPVLSPSLRGDSVSVAETVIHEITHTTYFPKGQARFNESFANFVGHVGAIEFFCEAQADPAPCEAARHRWHDVRVFGRFFQTLRESLEALYASDLPAPEKLASKRRIIEEAARRYQDDFVPQLRSGRYGGLDATRINNAWLLARLLYYSRLDDFHALAESRGGLKYAVEALVAEGGADPWGALNRLVPAAPAPEPDATPSGVPIDGAEDAPAAPGA